MYLFTICCFHITTKTKVVFYITAAHGGIRCSSSFKLAEYLLIGFTHDIGQYIQPAPVGHTDHYFFNTVIAGHIDNSIQCSDRGFAAFQ